MFAAVESDIVGYTQIEMQAGKWYQIGNPFGELDGADTFSANEAFSTGFSDGDILNLFDKQRSSYAVYYWNSALNGWSPFVGAPFLADIPLTKGKAVYIYKGNAGVVTLCGKVVEVSVPFGAENGGAWDQIVPMWPATAKLNDLKWEGLQSGDTVNILDPERAAYNVYYWDANTQQWTIAPGVPISADVELQIGQAVFVNKASSGVGTLSR